MKSLVKMAEQEYPEGYKEDMDMMHAQAKSSVKLIKNSKGLNWEIKVVAGEESLITNLRNVAVANHDALVKMFSVE